VAWGNLVFISGIRGIDPSTGAPAAGDARRLSLIFGHLARILEASGCAPRDVLAARVYVTEMSRHRPQVNEAFTKFFGSALPARTIVEVRALNQGDTIEIEVIAARHRQAAR
jgi:2-iminobutanoate/2-iminopropanoate deaminase